MKIHAVFSQLGFKQVEAKVSLPDQATLCAVEHWIYLQQGLVWKQMSANFAKEGTPVLCDSSQAHSCQLCRVKYALCVPSASAAHCSTPFDSLLHSLAIASHFLVEP